MGVIKISYFVLITFLSLTSYTKAQFTMNVAELDGSNGFKLTGLDGQDGSGGAIASGDINNDGIDDLIIGAAGADFGTNAEVGETYIIFGSEADFTADFDLSSLDGVNGFMISGFDVNENSGGTITSGDINGDGIDDVILKGTGGNGFLNRGVVYVIYGSENLFSPTVFLSDLNGTNGFVINGIDSQDAIGFALGIGDINNDAIDDLLISSISANQQGAINAGEVYVVFGNEQGFTAELALSDLDGNNGFTLTGIAQDNFIGDDLAAGDINGDGIDDVIIGANQVDVNGLIDAGTVYIYFGGENAFPGTLSLSEIDGTNGFKITGFKQNLFAGGAVSAADINNDGIDDVILGVSDATSIDTTYVVYGKNSTFPESISIDSLNNSKGFKIIGIEVNSPAQQQLGTEFSTGDVNADGIDDLIIGAFGVQFSGFSYVIYGDNSLGNGDPFLVSSLDGSNGFAIKGVGQNDFFGVNLSTGDINNDGLDDILIGAPQFNIDPNSTAGNNGGESYVVFSDAQEPVSNENAGIIPNSINLFQNYPNPFNPTSSIKFTIANTDFVKLQVFDLLGRSLAILVNENRNAGTHIVSFDASNLASGVYLYRLDVANRSITKKLTLVK